MKVCLCHLCLGGYVQDVLSITSTFKKKFLQGYNLRQIIGKILQPDVTSFHLSHLCKFKAKKMYQIFYIDTSVEQNKIMDNCDDLTGGEKIDFQAIVASFGQML